MIALAGRARAAGGPLALALLAVAAGGAAGALAVSGSDLVQLDVRWSPTIGIAALAGAVALLGMAARPVVGICLLLALVFSNASEILVREHGLPSVLQLLVPLLLVVLAVSPRRATAIPPRSGLRPDLSFLLAASAWLAVLLLSTTWAWDRELADEAVVTSLKAALLAVVVGWAIADVTALRAALWTLAATGAALAALSSYQVLTGAWEQSFGGFARVKQAHIAGTDLGPRATGPLADPNFYAQALLPLVPIAIALGLGARSRLLRGIAWTLGALAAVGVVTTYSRGGALALFAALALLGWMERRRIRAWHVGLALVLALAGLAVLPSSFFVRRLETLAVLLPGSAQPVERHDSSVAKRRVLMATAAAMALDQPLLGVGAGNYGTHFEDYAAHVGAQARIYHDPGERAFAHSLPLEVAAENGLAGLLAFGATCAAALAAAVMAARAFRRARDEPAALMASAILAGVVGTIVSSLILHGDYPRYLWLLFGLSVAAWRCAAKKGSDPFFGEARA